MEYKYLKEQLLSMFDSDKLHLFPEEWGFFNETERDIKRIGYATNLTGEIIERAREKEVDFLLTHHDSWEFIYGLKEHCNKMLRKAGMTHAFFHAPLDDADFGTSASLAQALGMKGCKKVMPYREQYYGGVAGEIVPTDFESFAASLSHILQENVRCHRNNDRPVCRIAVAAGGGNMTSDMRAAVELGCDTYVTGEYALYSQQYAGFCGMNLFVGSHTNTEILGVKSMAERLTCGGKIELIRIREPND